MTDPTIASWSRENDLLFQLRQLREENERMAKRNAELEALLERQTALLEQQQAEPVCPECKAAVLYECVACSSNNYPPQQQAEPVTCVACEGRPKGDNIPCAICGATPPQRPWVGLTEFQFAEIYNKWNDTNGSTPWGLNQALEAKLKELNT